MNPGRVRIMLGNEFRLRPTYESFYVMKNRGAVFSAPKKDDSTSGADLGTMLMRRQFPVNLINSPAVSKGGLLYTCMPCQTLF